MLDYKVVLGIVSVVLAFAGYVPYFRDMYLGKTKPHAFSWLLWGLMSAIAFFAQLSTEGGAGAWVLGASAFICLVIFILALFIGEKRIVLFDWICLALALAIIMFWRLTDDVLTAVILLTIIDAISFLPTFRKSYNKPYEETMAEYVLSAVKYLVGLFAISSFEITNWLYPVYLVLMNSIFVTMLVIRRKKLHQPRSS